MIQNILLIVVLVIAIANAVIIWFIFTFIIGAIGIITAGSDKNTLESARKKIITGIIGLVVTIAAIFVVDLISTLLGFGGVGLLNLEGLFSKIIE